MSKIKLNNTEFEFDSYNKNTYYGGETVSSNANCSLLNVDMADLSALAETTITSIEIRNNENTLVYDLKNINAKIDSINEYYNGMTMAISVNMIFQ